MPEKATTPITARVLIIGAGPSGIAAAASLVEAGFQNVSITEAENRIGGRIHTISFGDNVVDMGAQWCHGEKNNAVYETLKTTDNIDLLEHSPDNRKFVKLLRSNREVVNDEVADVLKTIMFESVPSKDDNLKSYKGSAGAHYVETFWSEYDKLSKEIDLTVAKEFFEHWKKNLLLVDSADNLFELAASSKADYWDCEGDNLLNWKDKGFRSILNVLMKTDDYNENLGLLKDKVKLNRKVTKIEWTHKDKIKITLFNGKIIMVDHVICTIPLGVLKANYEYMFKPALPLSKVRAIEGLKLGTVSKFFFEFENAFQLDDWHGFVCLWLEEDLKKLRETKFFWLEGVIGFFKVPHQPRLLQGWLAGTHVRYAETLSEEEVLKALMWLIRKFISFPIPDPIDFKRTQWYSNKNFRGTYSYRTLYADELLTGAWDLAEPLIDSQGRPLVQFAGEATHNHYFGTVHGAMETGWREAKRLIDYYQKQSENKHA
uniref:Amine oxidase domain-containing protein n=1 Tax=Glossina brevipalpis TaxID=37001 RepID=A0A1A9WL91_9MUSC